MDNNSNKKINPITPYLIYTDGSCVYSKTEKLKLNSWAFVVVSPMTNEIIHKNFGTLPICEKALSNDMELMAIEKALDWLPKDSIAILYSDSQNALDWTRKATHQSEEIPLNEGINAHYQNIKNIFKNSEKQYVHLKKVKAHRNDYWNNYVDYLCDQSSASCILGKLDDLFNNAGFLTPFMPLSDVPFIKFEQIEKLSELKKMKLQHLPYKLPLYRQSYNKEKLKESGIDLFNYNNFEREELVYFALKNNVRLKECQKGQICVQGEFGFTYYIDMPEQHIYHKSFGKIKYITPQDAINISLMKKEDFLQKVSEYSEEEITDDQHNEHNGDNNNDDDMDFLYVPAEKMKNVLVSAKFHKFINEFIVKSRKALKV